MNFEELHNITENFCNTHSFEVFGEPVFDYDHQCYDYDVPSTFFYSLRSAALRNEKLAKILVRLTAKEKLNNEEKLTIHILRMIESLEEHDKYICKSNRAKTKEELNALHRELQDVQLMIKEFHSLIEDLEDGNVNLREKFLDNPKFRTVFLAYPNLPEREDFETEQEYSQYVEEVMKENEEDAAKLEAQYQEYEAQIADGLAKIDQQLSEPDQEAKNMKLAS